MGSANSLNADFWTLPVPGPFQFQPATPGWYGFSARYNGTPDFDPSESACEPVLVKDVRIEITPLPVPMRWSRITRSRSRSNTDDWVTWSPLGPGCLRAGHGGFDTDRYRDDR